MIQFSWDAGAERVEKPLTNVQAGYGSVRERFRGFAADDVVNEAVLTISPATGGGSTIELRVSTTESADGVVQQIGRDWQVVFNLTGDDTATIASGDYEYAIRVFATPAGGDAKYRDPVGGAITAKAGLSTITTLAVQSVTITGGPVSGAPGSTTQLTATAKNAGGQPVAATITWRSSNTNVATVDANGIVELVNVGTATITATCQGHSASTTATCTDPAFASPQVGDVARYNGTRFVPYSLDAALASEASQRTAADASTLASANSHADAGDAAEATARANADATLQANIDAESTARAAAVALKQDLLGIRVTTADATGAADARAQLATDDAAAVAAGAPLGRKPGTYKVGSDLTLNAPLARSPGALFEPAAGTTLTVNGSLAEGAYPLFDRSLGGTVKISPKASSCIYPEWFGAVGDAATDDTAALQAAFDCVMGMNDLGGTGTLVLSRRYKITDSLHGFRFNAGAFTTTSFRIWAQARSYVSGQGVEIIPTFLDRPALILQKVRTVVIEGVTFRGAIATVAPSYDNLVLDTGGAGGTPWYNPNNLARDQAFSPYCAIAIDPFSNGVPADGGIPGHAAYYTTNSAGSSIVDVRDCLASNFIVGFMVNPSNGTQLGDSVTFRKCVLSSCKVPYAVGQSQDRGVVVENTHILYCRTAFDCVSYGVGVGPLPYVRGGVIAGGCKFLLNASSNWGSGSISQLYAESIRSLGFWGINSGGFKLTFHDCHFAMADVAGLECDSHLHAAGPVEFKGGFFGRYNNVVNRLNVFSSGSVVFDGTVLTGEVMASDYHRVRYKNCPLRYSNGGPQYGLSDRHAEGFLIFASNVDAQIGPMGEVLEVSSPSWMHWRFNNFSVNTTIDGAAALTVNGDGTASFPTANTARLVVGDWLSTPTAWVGEGVAGTSYANMGIGKVTAINAGVVTLGNVPRSLASGVFNIVRTRLPLFRPRTVGTTTNGSNVITQVGPTTMWRVGDEINSTSLPAGTRIQAIDGAAKSFTVSQNATATGTAELYDAKLWLEAATRPWAFGAPTNLTWFKGDFIRAENGASKDGNNLVQVGWLCTVSGVAGGSPAATFETIYAKTTSP